MSSPDRAVSRAEIVGSDLCIGCGGCARPDTGMRWDTHGQRKPDGPAAWLSAPDPVLTRTCPFSPGAAADENDIAEARFPDAPATHDLIGRYEAAYVGHAEEDGFRMGGSSGGMVSWVAAELLRRGLVDGVAHVSPRDPAEDGGRFFGYRISRSVEAVHEGAKSRYFPVDLAEVLEEIRTVPGRYAVVGVPCFIKAVHLLRREEPVLRERIAFTLGLFCGHNKSARMVESFAWQLSTRLPAVRAVEYRLKQPDRPANWYTAHLALRDGSIRQQDWWHLADGDWGAGFFQNPACNYCDDVVAETADVAFGDAWVEPYSSDGRGTNVVVVRSPEIAAMVDQARAENRLTLDQVDADFIVQTQAAGFRHRREGLAYRLTWAKGGLTPVKRVLPGRGALPLRRRLVYRLRFGIAKWSHRIFAAARRLDRPALYTRWAKASLRLYQALTWSQGRLGAAFDRIERMMAAK
ncbi:Coenzyme F420 hydrogenase/dehydrogenase, beta subunit C-terminal domain [uncultured Sphingomonas sp.]|uniref:Coenzyme F420 hydrogenase/dehydrogenase, beta subunit C-terminal domain n=1 Tax=uncultured Sphingomonas sp. TaxID=158754 RepID=UPI0026006F74|nr:Coenzyme F420 hydrogenase/dehydrogenase, beta subunit C-terminal domain [uncultured Sphingomonas sp.]